MSLMTLELLPDPEEYEVAHSAAIIEAELRNGYLWDIARARVDEVPSEDATPRDIANVIIRDPDVTQERELRWRMLESAEGSQATRDAIAANGERIISTAEALALRRLVNGERQPEDIEAIVPDNAVFVVEGGANKTSVIRRGVAVKAMREVYGDDLSHQTLYQFGSGRVIAPTREKTKKDGPKEVVPNPEHQTIRSLADEFLPATAPFTEFEANLATARADGYEVQSDEAVGDSMLIRRVELTHADVSRPRLVLIQPSGKAKLQDGFAALEPILSDKQLVIATNGQYREKCKYTAAMWARDSNMGMLSPVALGDEPGDVFPFRDGLETTAERPAALYVNELVILWYLAQRRLADREYTELEPAKDELTEPLGDYSDRLGRFVGTLLWLAGAMIEEVSANGMLKVTERAPTSPGSRATNVRAVLFVLALYGQDRGREESA